MKLIEDLGMVYATINSKKKNRYGIYECPICFEHIRTLTSHAKRGNSTKCRSCSSSIMKKKHGLSHSSIHNIWIGMRNRCSNKNASNYKWYGGVGISVCEEWNDFLVFHKWSLENGYIDGLTIERIDSNDGYKPSNCEWITQAENISRSSVRKNYGKNNTIKVSEDEASEICEAYATGLFTQKEIGDYLNVSHGTVSSIIVKSRNTLEAEDLL